MTSFFDPAFKNHDFSSDVTPLFSDVKPSKDEIKGYEFQHAFYVRPEGMDKDLIFIKEYVHLKDGRMLLNYRSLYDWERPYWLTRPENRTHKDKLEYAPLDTLNEFRTPQWNLENDIAFRLRHMGNKRDLRTLCSKPWVYGATISPISFIRHQYKKQNPDCTHPVSTVTWVDSETDVVHGTDETIIVQASFRKRAIIAVAEWWLADVVDAPARFFEALHKYMGDLIEKRQCMVEFYIAKNAGDAVATVAKRIKEWETDYVEVWNIDYDLPRFINMLQKYGYSVEDAFCHDSIPPGFRCVEYAQGKDKHISKKGVETKLAGKQRWHTFNAPAAATWIDGMCYYYQRRKQDGMISCGLDATMKRHIGIGKLEHDCGQPEGTLNWHKEMQRNHKIIYMVYSMNDVIPGEMLDEKIGDIRLHFKVDLGDTTFDKFTSLPKQYADTFHHYIYDEMGWAMGTPSENLGNEFDEILIDQYDWIVTLPTHNMEPSGIPVIKELPHLKSQIYIHSADADVVRTYPMVNVNANVSRRTTYREPTIRIKGLSETQRRHWGIDLTGADVNAIDLCVTGLNMPYPDELRVLYRKKKEEEAKQQELI